MILTFKVVYMKEHIYMMENFIFKPHMSVFSFFFF